MGWDRRGGTRGEGKGEEGGKGWFPKSPPLKILAPPLFGERCRRWFTTAEVSNFTSRSSKVAPIES